MNPLPLIRLECTLYQFKLCVSNRIALCDDNNKYMCLLFSLRPQSAEEIASVEDTVDKKLWPKTVDK